MRKKISKILTIVLAASLLLTACNSEAKSDAESEISLSRTYKFPDLDIDKYEYYDYKEHAQAFDDLVFVKGKASSPELIWTDKTYDTFGIAAYVGDYRHGKDGDEEAITTMAAVLSASLIGIDKANEHENNYVDQLNSYFSESEKVVLNNLNSRSREISFWYQIYPCLLFAKISILYPEQNILRKNCLQMLESWYEAYEVLYPNSEEANFNHTGFDFEKMQAYDNEIWTEPDSAVGIAHLMDMAYELSGEVKYLKAAKNCLEYIESYFGGPLYELLEYYSPYLSSKYNLLYDTNIDIEREFGRVFDGASNVRGGWGVINDTWSDYDVSGLFGSRTDRNGYAFAMNTFAGLDALIPSVKYNHKYANSIGELILRTTNNAKYFFSEFSEPENQSLKNAEINIDPEISNLVPYEGIINTYGGKTPWFGGYPLINDWALSDFSLYSGAHIGIFSHRISETNIDAVLKVDINEISNKEQFPSYLIYNPYNKSIKVEYLNNSDEEIKLYECISNKLICEELGQNETLNLEIEANSSLIITELSKDAEISQKDNLIEADDIYLSY